MAPKKCQHTHKNMQKTRLDPKKGVGGGLGRFLVTSKVLVGSGPGDVTAKRSLTKKNSVRYKNDPEKGKLADGAEGAARRASGARRRKIVGTPTKTCKKHVLTQKNGFGGGLGRFLMTSKVPVGSGPGDVTAT